MTGMKTSDYDYHPSRVDCADADRSSRRLAPAGGRSPVGDAGAPPFRRSAGISARRRPAGGQQQPRDPGPPAWDKTDGRQRGVFLARPAADREPATWDVLSAGRGCGPASAYRCSATGRRPRGDITATILAETESGSRVVAFDPPVEQWLWDAGEVPLPPYIHHPLADPERYQTVYSRMEGSVASSTAGLHFTPEMLVRAAGARRAAGVRHAAHRAGHLPAGAGREHRGAPHPSRVGGTERETARAINETKLAGGRVIAVGTTVVRTLESAAKIALGYRPCDEIPAGAACGWQTVAAFAGETDLFIRPGHVFRAVDAMITNFHLPKSTLLMLVSAFAGKGLIDRAYAEAIRERYRFYSFGDAMLIL